MNKYIKSVNVNLSFATVLKTSAFLILLFLIVELKELALVFLTAIVLASSIEPFIKKMEKMSVPRILSVTFVYLILTLVIAGISFLFIPLIIDQISIFIKQLPNHVSSLNIWLDGLVDSNSVLATVVEQIKERISGFSSSFSESENLNKIKDGGKAFGGMILGLFGGLLNFALVLIFSFYLAIQDHGIENFLKIVTPVKYTKYALSLWRRTQKKISLWMQGQLALGFIIGILTYIGLTIFFDFEQTLLLAVIAAIAELVPIVGPFIAAIPALIIAIMDGGWSLVGAVAIFYLAIQMIENQVIYPMVVKKVVGVPSILVILSLIIGVQLFGFLGAILAIPLAAALMEYVNDVDKRQKEALKCGEEEEIDLSQKQGKEKKVDDKIKKSKKIK